MRVVHVIRHARPALTGVMLGWSDVGLDGAPIAPSPLAVDYVFASPLRRSLETAAALFPATPIQVLDELSERGMGEWEGKSWVEIEQGWPVLAAQAAKDWFAVTPPGGEAWTDFYSRVERAFDAIPEEGTTAIVGHVGVNALLRFLAGQGEFAAFQQNYCEVVTLD